jgi:hypothetical protein
MYETVNEIEEDIKIHIRNMLENILTLNELKKLAVNKDITVKIPGKEGLIEKISEKFFTNEKFVEFYNLLPISYQLLLHYMRVHQAAMGIRDIKRYINYHDDYRKLFSDLKQELAVNGLTVIIERKGCYYYSQSQLERFSFYLSPEFYDILPRLPVKGIKLNEKGTGNSLQDFAKNILLFLLDLKTPERKIDKDITEAIKPYKDKISRDNFIDHLIGGWSKNNFLYDMDICGYLIYILNNLPDGEWIGLSKLKDFFQQFTMCSHTEKLKGIIAAVCREGVNTGLFEKIEKVDEEYYRASSPPSEKPPASVKIEQDGTVSLDVKETPVAVILDMLEISDWKYADNKFIFTPSLLKLGKIYREKSGFSSLLVNYLKDITKKYKEAFLYVEKEYGKIMVHSGLAIFEINDITVSALLEHNFSDIFHRLEGNFFAAAKKDEETICNFLNQKKYSIRVKE